MSEAVAHPGHSGSTFDFVPIVISHYSSCPNLTTADDEAERVAAILSRWGGELRPWDVEGPKRSSDTVLARLASWSQPAVSRSSLLLWISHGWSSDDDAGVYLPAEQTDVSLGPIELANYVVCEHGLRDEPDWAIVVVEACGGIRFAEMMQAHLALRRVRNGVLLIGSGEDRGKAYLGSFRRALEKVDEAYWSNDKVISLSDLANKLDEALQPGFVRAMGLAGRFTLSPRRDLTPTLTTAVDFYPDLRDVLAEVPESELERLARSGLGSDLLETGGHFVGRVTERSKVATWMETHHTGMFVLTGEPGSGKSALLANLMLHAVPSLHLALEQAPHLGAGWVGGRPVPPVDGALLMTGAATTDVVTRLARIAEIELPANLRPSERATALVQMLAERGLPLTLFADALDEAQDPAEIAALLVRLTELAGVRIVLATRARSGLDGVEGSLLEQLRSPDGDLTVLTLHGDRAASLEFTAARLQAAGSGVPAEDLDMALADVAGRLPVRPGADAGWDFLHVRLLITELLATPDLLFSAFAGERRRMMALDRPTLFLRAMERLASTHPRAESLLLALACAQGRGLPRADRIWATVAGVLTPGYKFTEADIDQVLRAAGPYIMLDAEEDRSVFRLAHRTFTDELLARLDRQTRTAVLEALVELTREAADPAPYLRRHLSGHAAALGRQGWSAFGVAPDVLDRLDLDTLLADSWRSSADDLPPSVLGVRRTAHLALAGAEEDRCGYRQLGAAREAGHYSSIIEAVAGAAWQVTRARLVHHPSHQTNAPGPPVPVRSLAVCTVADGTVVIAFGNDHGRIRLWNPWRGSTVEVTHDTDRGGEILGLAALDGARGLMLASVGPGQSTRLWPLADDRVPSELAEHDGGTGCVIEVCPTDDGTLLLAVGTTRGRLRLVTPDGATLQSAPKQLKGHAGRITGLATIGGARGRVLLSVSVDRSLRLWGLPYGWRGAKAFWRTPLQSVAVAEQAGLILTGDAEGVVTVWNRDNLEPIRWFHAHDGAIHALALVPDESGRIILASGGADRRVRFWDAAAAVPSGSDLTGHDDVVTDLVTLRSPDGSPLVASCSRDGKVKIWTPTAVTAQPPSVTRLSGASRQESPERWDLATSDGRAVTLTRTHSGHLSCRLADGPAVALPWGAARSRCAAVITGESAVVVATSNSDVIHTWHADTGAEAGPPLHGHQDWVRALLALKLEDGLSVLVSGGVDGRVCIWDPWSGDLRHRIELGSAVQSLSPAACARQFAVVLDDGKIEIEVEDAILRGAEGGIRT